MQPLADAARAAVPAWLVRCVIDTAHRMGAVPTAQMRADAQAMADEAAPGVLAELDVLLATDADAQARNPLSVLRAAVRHPTAVLTSHGVSAPTRDDFAVRNFPDDVYGLSPATFADVDVSLQEPGLIWGAWKAKTVLDRRRGHGMIPPA